MTSLMFSEESPGSCPCACPASLAIRSMAATTQTKAPLSLILSTPFHPQMKFGVTNIMHREPRATCFLGFDLPSSLNGCRPGGRVAGSPEEFRLDWVGFVVAPRG